MGVSLGCSSAPWRPRARACDRAHPPVDVELTSLRPAGLAF